ncbi:MAG: hypothetical protein JWP52_2830, partial [Rhizobacter sp.]|nr:hypothetical protein [Rhizobacter sp.]
MQTASAIQPSHATQPLTASAAPRFDIYCAIHKALRNFMGDTLFQIGRLDVSDPDEMTCALGQVDDLLDLCISHIHHENDFVHAAINARQPGGAAATERDHEEHMASIDRLRAQTRALRAAKLPARAPLARRLYQHLALFVAENFEHMNVEETVNNAALWALYTDAELLAIDQRLMASVPPKEQVAMARWLMPALSPTERAMLLGGIKLAAPNE